MDSTVHVFISPPPPSRDFTTYMYSFPPPLPWLQHIHVFIPPSPPWLQHIHVFISPLPFVTSTHTCIHPPPPMTSTHNVLHPPPPTSPWLHRIHLFHPPPPPPPPVTSLHTYIRSFPSLAEVRSCVKVEVVVWASLVPTVSVDVKQHWTDTEVRSRVKVEVAVLGPTCPYGLCGRKATLNRHRGQEPCESGGGRPGPHLSLRSLWT